jgi:hypothetical protein
MDWPPAVFSATLAPAGTTKLPSDPLTVMFLLAMAGPVVGGGEDVIPLEAAELDAPALAVLLAPPVDELAAEELAADEQAATDKLAAHAARASAAERYFIIRSPYRSSRSTRTEQPRDARPRQIDSAAATIDGDQPGCGPL